MNFLQIAQNTFKSSTGSPGVFHRSSWPLEKTATIKCFPAKCADSGPMSLPYSFNHPGQLKNWLRVQGGSPKLYCFGNKFLFGEPSSSRRIAKCSEFSSSGCDGVSRCPSTNPPRYAPLNRTWDVEWAWFNTHPAVGFLRRCRHPRAFRCNRTRCGGGTCRKKKKKHHCWSRLGHNSFVISFWILFVIVKQLFKLKFLVQQVELTSLMFQKWRKNVPLITCEIPFGQNVCGLMFGVNASNLKSCRTTNPKQLCGSLTHVSLWDFEDIQHSIGTKMCCVWWNLINACCNNVGVLDWDGVMHVWLVNFRKVSQ